MFCIYDIMQCCGKYVNVCLKLGAVLGQYITPTIVCLLALDTNYMNNDSKTRGITCIKTLRSSRTL